MRHLKASEIFGEAPKDAPAAFIRSRAEMRLGAIRISHPELADMNIRKRIRNLGRISEQTLRRRLRTLLAEIGITE